MYEVIQNNKITFNRINDSAILKYKIMAKEEIPGVGVKEYYLDEIKNPTTAQPILKKAEFILNESNEYVLPKGEMFVSLTYPVNVFINGHNKLKQEMFNVKPNENKVKILYEQLEEKSIVRIEYYIDAIEFEHKTNNRCEYDIIPVLDQGSGNIGVHTKLI